jgi:hypothetical protein
MTTSAVLRDEYHLLQELGAPAHKACDASKSTLAKGAKQAPACQDVWILLIYLYIRGLTLGFVALAGCHREMMVL